VRRPAVAYALSLAALAAAIALRWLLDPVIGGALPLVTLFGAVAASVWLGGAVPAALVAVLGYLACDYLIMAPRGQLELADMGRAVGIVAYLFTCSIIIVFGQAARKRERERASQLLTARLLGSIVESSDDAIISKSLDGVIQSWNAAAERLFGYTAEQAVGRHISLVIPKERLAEEGEIVANLEAGRRIEHFETQRVRADGRRIDVSLTISPLKDDAGRVIGASKIARDVTERKRMEDDLRKLAADLSEAGRRKDEFLAMLAHELRNPLAALSNAAQVLRRAGSDETAVGTASAMLGRQVRQMTRLVDDLLDMSRVTQGKIELRKERVDLASILDQAVDSARPLVTSMGHELTVSMPAQPVQVEADPARLAQVVGNLLNNAAKFTDKGGRVSLALEREGDQARIRVRDNGIGIASEQMPRVFDMFMQADTSLERSRDGLGIGLTLVKKLVEMHGGTVEVHSAGQGQGSEFVVRLPALPDTRTAPAPTAPSQPARAAGHRILIVDDNADGAESLAMLLQLGGYVTQTAHDGREAVEAAERMRPHAVLLDIGLPGLNGYEVCRRIRDKSWGAGVLLVAVTGWGQEADRQRSRDAGFDTHVVKPIDHDALMRLLATLPAEATGPAEARLTERP
jgi:PAS domain S-box-containing protein